MILEKEKHTNYLDNPREQESGEEKPVLRESKKKRKEKGETKLKKEREKERKKREMRKE